MAKPENLIIIDEHGVIVSRNEMIANSTRAMMREKLMNKWLILSWWP